jgi:hypothetical protein
MRAADWQAAMRAADWQAATDNRGGVCMRPPRCGYCQGLDREPMVDDAKELSQLRPSNCRTVTERMLSRWMHAAVTAYPSGLDRGT